MGRVIIVIDIVCSTPGIYTLLPAILIVSQRGFHCLYTSLFKEHTLMGVDPLMFRENQMSVNW
jgi:hypothetical protein